MFHKCFPVFTRSFVLVSNDGLGNNLCCLYYLSYLYPFIFRMSLEDIARTKNRSKNQWVLVKTRRTLMVFPECLSNNSKAALISLILNSSVISFLTLFFIEGKRANT